MKKVPLEIVIPIYNEGNKVIRLLEDFSVSIKTEFRVFFCYDLDDILVISDIYLNLTSILNRLFNFIYAFTTNQFNKMRQPQGKVCTQLYRSWDRCVHRQVFWVWKQGCSNPVVGLERDGFNGSDFKFNSFVRGSYGDWY